MIPVFEYVKTSSRPRYSILIPSFNRPEYIMETITSANNLDYTDFEIVVSDDKSPLFPQIAEKIQSLAYNCNVRLYHQDTNLKWSGNRNFLVAKARGEYVILLGDDDILDKDLLRQLDRSMQQGNRDADITAFGYRVVDEYGACVYTRNVPRKMHISLSEDHYLKDMMESGIFPFRFFHPFTLCYKQELHKQFTYNAAAHIGDDYLFLYECLNGGKAIEIIPYIGFSWRKAQRMDKAYINLSSHGVNNIIARVNIWNLFFSRDDLNPKIADMLHGDFIERYMGDPVVIDKSLDRQRVYAILEKELDKETCGRVIAYVEAKKKKGVWPIRLRQLAQFVRVTRQSAIYLLFKDFQDKLRFSLKNLS